MKRWATPLNSLAPRKSSGLDAAISVRSVVAIRSCFAKPLRYEVHHGSPQLCPLPWWMTTSLLLCKAFFHKFTVDVSPCLTKQRDDPLWACPVLSCTCPAERRMRQNSKAALLACCDLDYMSSCQNPVTFAAHVEVHIIPSCHIQIHTQRKGIDIRYWMPRGSCLVAMDL